MPTYSVRCLECGADYSKRLSFADYDKVKSGESFIACKSCQGRAELAFDPGRVAFVLKEGESGGWASKSIKENEYRAKRRDVMARRERDHVFKNTLQANYDGVETGSWRDAQELARKEKGSEAAASYDPLVTREKSTS
jgi:hypothetical protein